MKHQDTKRIFFALLPDEPLREKIRQFQKSCARLYPHARPVAVDNFHMTLHFIGQADEHRLKALDLAAASVQGAEVECLLDRAGYFSRPRVFYLGASQVSDSLQQLVLSLGRALQGCDYEPRFARYVPHVSLFRKFSVAEQALPLPRPEPVCFAARQFVMMESLSTADGVKYQPIQSYTLG